MTRYEMLVDDGYIENGMPKKCWECNCDILETGNTWTDIQGIVEYETICSKCKLVLSSYSYGTTFYNIEYGEIHF